MQNLNFKNWFEQNYPVVSTSRRGNTGFPGGNTLTKLMKVMGKAHQQDFMSRYKTAPEEWPNDTDMGSYRGQGNIDTKEWSVVIPKRIIGEKPVDNSKQLNKIAAQIFYRYLKDSKRHQTYANLDWNSTETKIIREQPAKTETGEEPGFLVAVAVPVKVQTRRSERGYF